MKYLIGIILGFCIGAPAILINALVTMKIWGWFVVPYFHLIPLTIPLAIGLHLLVIILRPHAISASAKNKDESFWDFFCRYIGHIYFGPFITLFAAYIAHLYL